MPRPWQYTRSRRTMMQVVMWLILGGTVGLAALVDHYRSNPQNMSLGSAVPLGPIQLHPPVGWRAARDHGRWQFQEEGADPDNESEDTGRVMLVEAERPGTSHVDRFFLVKAKEIGEPVGAATVTPMCGQKGLLATVVEPTVPVDGQRVPEGWSVLACTIVPTGPGSAAGVSIRLHTPRRPTGADLALVKAVARTMTTGSGAPQVGPARSKPEASPAPRPPDEPDDQ